MERLDRIEPPGQLISFLTDPLLQKYVELKPSPVVYARIELWLAACFEGHVSVDIAETAVLGELLDGLLKHAQYSKVGVSALARTLLTLLDSTSNRASLPQGVPANVEWP